MTSDWQRPHVGKFMLTKLKKKNECTSATLTSLHILMKCVIASSAKFMENKEKKIVGVFDSIKYVVESKKKKLRELIKQRKI